MADEETAITPETTGPIDEKMKSGELIPPEKDDDVGPAVYKVLAQILKYKAAMGFPEKWKRGYELKKGKHWRNTAQKGIPFIAVNLVYTHLQKNVNMLTDNNPTFNIARLADVKPAEEEAFELMQHSAEHWWIDQEQQDVLDTSVNKGENYGCCIEKVIFNSDLFYGQGEVETINVDPFHFGVYPPAKIKEARNLQKAEAVLHFYPMNVREARNNPNWKDKADAIRPDREFYELLGDDRLEVSKGEPSSRLQGAVVSIMNTVKELLNFTSSDPGEDTDELLVVECWVRDRTRTKVKDDESKTMPKYPGEMRYIACCNGGNVVLEDKPNPSINPDLTLEQARMTYLFDKFPFIIANSVKDDMHIYGQSEVEQLEFLNMQFNKSISQLVSAKDKAAKTILMNPRTSGVKNEDLNRYSVTVQPSSANEAQGIRYLDPPTLAPEIAGSITLFKELFFLVSQSFNMDRAQQPGSQVLAYKAIAALLENATTMMKGKVRNYSRLVRERGRMYLSHSQNWYTDDRWITYTDEGGQEVSRAIKGSMLLFPAKLTVVTGSTMPVSKVQRREEAIALFGSNGCDVEYLHEALETPHRSELIKRMRMGPMGIVFDKLRQLGAPEPVIDYLTKVTEVKDDKELKTMVEKGEIPPFPVFAQMLMQAMSQGQGEEETGPTVQERVEEALSQVKIEETQAKIAKEQADTALIAEKIVTERVEQRVKLKGIEFDEAKIALERTQVLHQLAGKLDDKMPSTDKAGYNERGMESNNVE